MITLFRKIRKRLISKGNFYTYLFYAIGEVLLVVVGILIALQINNWNQNRQDRKEEMLYLKRLQLDMQADTSRWLSNLKTIDFKSKFLMGLLNNEIDSFLNSPQFHRYLFSSRFRELPVTNKSTMNELTSSGKIGLIQNVELKEKILEYYSFIDARTKALENTLSEWPRLISKLVPGEIHFKSRAYRTDFRKIEKEMLIKVLQKNRNNLTPEINAELGYTAIQYRSYRDMKLKALALLELLNSRTDLSESDRQPK